MTHGRETTSLTPPSKNEIHSLYFIMHGSNDLDSPVEIMSSIAICEKYQSIYIHLQLNLKAEFTYLYKDLRIRNCITGCVHTASSIVLRTLCPTLHWISNKLSLEDYISLFIQLWSLEVRNVNNFTKRWNKWQSQKTHIQLSNNYRCALHAALFYTLFQYNMFIDWNQKTIHIF